MASLTFFLVFTYLIGSFVSVSFNPSLWSNEFRVPFGIISAILSFLISAMITDNHIHDGDNHSN